MSNFKNRLLDYLFLNKYWKKLWWKYCKGTTIQIKVPTTGIIIPVEEFDNFLVNIIVYLESHVGIMGYDWNIRHNFLFDWVCQLYYYNDGSNLEIKFRKKKEKYATICSLMWS